RRRRDALIAHAAVPVVDPPVRHRGTIGGSFSQADPSADVPTALLAIGATYVVSGRDGRRTVAAEDFATGFLETVLSPEEMLTEIRVPKSGAGFGYHKVTRPPSDRATVARAAVRRRARPV